MTEFDRRRQRITYNFVRLVSFMTIVTSLYYVGRTRLAWDENFILKAWPIYFSVLIAAISFIVLTIQWEVNDRNEKKALQEEQDDEDAEAEAEEALSSGALAE